METFSQKLSLIKDYIKDIKNPTILELGVQEGRSTKMFLEVCDENDGNLISVDILDCSKVSNNPRWKFIKYCFFFRLIFDEYSRISFRYWYT